MGPLARLFDRLGEENQNDIRYRRAVARATGRPYAEVSSMTDAQADELMRERLVQADLIFDIGMDECQDTELYLKKGFRVVAVDANPTVCAAAGWRYAKQVKSGQLTILCRAISETRAALPFYVCTSASKFSTADPTMRRWQEERWGQTFEEIEVEAITVADLIAEYGVPYYAKVDIEGYDMLCVEGFRDLKVKPKYLSTELELRDFAKHIALVRSLGYRRYALVPQGRVKDQIPPFPPREGIYAEHRFVVGASGLFGKELPARWMGGEALLWTYRLTWLQFKVTGACMRLERWAGPLAGLLKRFRDSLPVAGQWYDIHATR